VERRLLFHGLNQSGKVSKKFSTDFLAAGFCCVFVEIQENHGQMRPGAILNSKGIARDSVHEGQHHNALNHAKIALLRDPNQIRLSSTAGPGDAHCISAIRRRDDPRGIN
jgi:hypothetical protein